MNEVKKYKSVNEFIEAQPEEIKVSLKNILEAAPEAEEIFLYGSDVLGNTGNLLKWLNLPNAAFGGMAPLELIKIPGGISKVRDVLGRIEHSVYG